MPPRRRRGGETRSWGDANEYGFEHGETVYIGRNDRRHGVVAHELVAHELVAHKVEDIEPDKQGKLATLGFCTPAATWQPPRCPTPAP